MYKNTKKIKNASGFVNFFHDDVLVYHSHLVLGLYNWNESCTVEWHAWHKAALSRLDPRPSHAKHGSITIFNHISYMYIQISSIPCS